MELAWQRWHLGIELLDMVDYLSLNAEWELRNLFCEQFLKVEMTESESENKIGVAEKKELHLLRLPLFILQQSGSLLALRWNASTGPATGKKIFSYSIQKPC